jgi:hypothetical protein
MLPLRQLAASRVKVKLKWLKQLRMRYLIDITYWFKLALAPENHLPI